MADVPRRRTGPGLPYLVKAGYTSWKATGKIGNTYSYTGYPNLGTICGPKCFIAYINDFSTGIIRFFTKQIATEGYSTVFGQWRCAL